MNTLLSNDIHRLTGRKPLFLSLCRFALCLLFIVVLLSCAVRQAQKDYELATSLDTISAYEIFIRKYPESKYTPNVTKRLQTLRESQKREDIQRETLEVARELEITKRVSELTAENIKRIKKLNNYMAGTVTLTEFLDDGWNLDDPYGGKLGIVGIVHDKGAPARKSVAIIMGFSYKPAALDGKPPVDPFLLKRHREALKAELSNLIQDNGNPQMNIMPLRTNQAGKERYSPDDPQASEPFFESTALVKFDDGLLKDVDLSGLKYVNLKQLTDLERSVFRCVITYDWLERTAGRSTNVPPPTADDIRQVFSARGLDEIQIDYKPKDETNFQGTGTVIGEKHPYLINKENVTYLPAGENESGLINEAVLDRASGMLRLNFDLPQGKQLTVEYQCEPHN